MAQHTPGPWEIWQGNNAIFAGPAKKNTPGYIEGYRKQICEADDMDVSEGELKANLHLIAAAPDLLAACKNFVAKVERGQARSTESYAEMKAAITKAEGKQP